MKIARSLAGTGLALLILAVAAGSPAAAEVTTKVKAGEGVTFESSDGESSLNLGFYGQLAFQALDRDHWRRSDLNQTFPPFSVENIGDTSYSFRIRRLRLIAKGKAFKPWFHYMLELDLVGNDEGLRRVFVPSFEVITGGTVIFPGIDITAGAESRDGQTTKLLEYYVDLTPLAEAGVRIGAFKTPFGRQELVSSSRLQMSDRSIASDFFAPSYDRGAVFHGATATGRIGYEIGAMNGTGIAQGANIDESLGYVARLTATSAGPYLNVESVIDNPSTFKAQGGFAWYKTTNTPVRQDPRLAISDVRSTSLSGDFEFFFGRRANLTMEYYSRKIDVDQTLDFPVSCYGAFVAGRFSCDQQGYFVQGGVFLGDRYELAGRYSQIDNDLDTPDDKSREATLNFTRYFRGHSLRWSTALSRFKIDVKAVGSSAFTVILANQPQATFPDPAASFPGIQGDDNTLFTTQLQWIF